MLNAVELGIFCHANNRNGDFCLCKLEINIRVFVEV